MISCASRLLPPAMRETVSLIRVIGSKLKVRNYFKLSTNLINIFSGQEVLRTLYAVKKNLGKTDVRCLGKPSLIRELKDFSSLLQDEDIGRRVSGAVSSDLEKRIDKLDSNLAQSWNSDIEDEVEDSVREDRNTQNIRDQTGANLTSQVTPRKDAESKADVFYKFSPLSQTREKIKCPMCESSYQLVRSVNEHISAKHPGQAPLTGVSDPKGHCKLPSKKDETQQCGISFETHQVNRHLKAVHKVVCPKGQHLRGWTSKDNGKTWSAVFLPKDAPDPDTQIFIYEASENYQELNTEAEKDSDKPMAAKSIEKKMESTEEEVNLDGKATESLEDDLKKRTKQKENEGSIGVVEQGQSYRSPQPFGLIDEFVTEVPEPSQSYKVSRALFGSPKKKSPSNILKVTVADEENIMIDIDGDNYVENDDTLLYTRERILQKQQRYQARDQVDLTLLKDLNGNIEVFEDLQKYLKRKTFLIENKEESNPKINKVLGHIILYEDSLLSYESKKDPSFRLNKLIDFKESDCLELDHPLDWITSTTQNHPGRGIEKLKAHSVFRNYMLHKLANTKMAGNFEMATRKMCLREGLENITRSIKEDGLYNQYTTLYHNEREEIKAAKYVLDPSQSEKAARSVQTWNESTTAKEQAKYWNDVYLEAKKKKKKPAAKDFNGFGSYVRFLCAISDKNRGGAYKFSLKSYTSKQKQYYPENYDGFSSLPDGWDVNKSPAPGTKPSMWVIRLHGAFMKGKKGGEIFLTPTTLDWCEKYRSFRQLVFKTEDKESSFFCNYNGQPLSQIKTTRGTIWAKFEEVTGVTKATITNCVRSAAEEVIQDNPEMANRVKQLNNHSLAVGSQVYDRNKYSYRGQFINLMSHKEGEKIASGSVEDAELEAEIKEREEADEKQNMEDAIKAVEMDKNRRRTTLSSQTRVKPEHRIFLQNLFKRLVGSRFPGKIPVIRKTHYY